MCCLSGASYALGEGKDTPFAIATKSPLAGVKARLPGARAGAPSPAERRGRVCSEKSERSKTPRRRSRRAFAFADWLPQGGGKIVSR